ncbi:MAG: MATE family efflux transporter [Clostridia bacterium]|nr:MATE family efflux transporter [Clostridia bacterium]
MKKKISMDMTEGVIWKLLLRFAVPLMLSELVQTLYSMVDSVIVGRFCGTEALAAVGATGNVVKMLVGFFTGISVGYTVVVGQNFGKKDEQGVKDSVHTIVSLSLLLGIVLTIVGVLITDPILRMLDTPADVFSLAAIYVRTYFMGIIGLVMYNTAAGILRAVGDSANPAKFLLISSVLNVVLDLVLVIWIPMGVRGVALATVISQLVSAVLAFRVLLAADGPYRVNPKELILRKGILAKIFSNGLPIGLQKFLTSFSNVIVISYMSPFGSTCLAGWAIYTKLHHLTMIMLQSIGSAETTFVSQNVGKGDYGRVRSCVRVASAMSVIALAVVGVLLYIFVPSVAGVWGDDAEVIAYAVMFVRTILTLEITHAFNQVFAGALRGMGKAAVSTLAMIAGLVCGRQIYLYFITKVIYTPQVVGIAYPVGWLSAGILLFIVYKRAMEKMAARPAPQQA